MDLILLVAHNFMTPNFLVVLFLLCISSLNFAAEIIEITNLGVIESDNISDRKGSRFFRVRQPSDKERYISLELDKVLFPDPYKGKPIILNDELRKKFLRSDPVVVDGWEIVFFRDAASDEVLIFFSMQTIEGHSALSVIYRCKK